MPVVFRCKVDLGRLPRHRCRGLIEAWKPLACSTTTPAVFRGIDAAASLKLSVFRGIDAAASLKRGRCGIISHSRRQVFRGIDAAASLKRNELEPIR